MNLLNPESRVEDIIWRYYSSSFEYDWRMDNPHHHDAVEFIYVVEGGCRLHFSHNVISPSKNDLIIVSSNSVHSCEVTDKQGCTLINIHLLLKNNLADSVASNELFSGFIQASFSTDSFIRFFNCIDIHPVIKNIAVELEGGQAGWNRIVRNDIEKMIIILCRKFNSRTGVTAHNLLSPYVQAAVSFIENSITDELSADAIAAAVHVSVDYLMHLFRNELGQSLMHFVRERKIMFAKELLSGTDMKIIDVAAETGFTNAQHFSTVFKKYADGITPSSFRTRSRQLNNSDKNIFR